MNIVSAIAPYGEPCDIPLAAARQTAKRREIAKIRFDSVSPRQRKNRGRYIVFARIDRNDRENDDVAKIEINPTSAHAASRGNTAFANRVDPSQVGSRDSRRDACTDARRHVENSQPSSKGTFLSARARIAMRFLAESSILRRKAAGSPRREKDSRLAFTTDGSETGTRARARAREDGATSTCATARPVQNAKTQPLPSRPSFLFLFLSV